MYIRRTTEEENAIGRHRRGLWYMPAAELRPPTDGDRKDEEGVGDRIPEHLPRHAENMALDRLAFSGPSPSAVPLNEAEPYRPIVDEDVPPEPEL